MRTRFPRADPGECPICGAAHCSCGGGPIEVVQLPQRDAAAAAPEGGPPDLAIVVAPAPAPESFTTATYRGKKKKP